MRFTEKVKKSVFYHPDLFIFCDSAASLALIDLNGTLHVGKQVLHVGDSLRSLAKLQASGVKCCFLTNNSKESTLKLVQKIQSIGFNISPNEVNDALPSRAP